MDWLDPALDRLAAEEACGYRHGDAPATEPTALAAMALLRHERAPEGEIKLRWLADVQAEDGSVGVRANEPAPRWPTSLAILAWRNSADIAGGSDFQNNVFANNVQQAVRWLLGMTGRTFPRGNHGHDSTLKGWPWVEATHSWMEPTAWSLLALKAAGQPHHPRAREAVRLLIDRLLPGGGCNYGNTIILGQKLRPHVQPTGLVLAALADEDDSTGRIARSLAYLRRELSEETTAASLSYGLLGMAAHGETPAAADAWLERAAEAALRRGALLQLALLSLATLRDRLPLAPTTTARN